MARDKALQLEALQLMDQLETLVLKKGWPVPFSPYYLVNCEGLLALLDSLRGSLQDELDSRFLTAFGKKAPHSATRPQKAYGKER